MPATKFVNQEISFTEAEKQRFQSQISINGPIPDQSMPHYQGLGPCHQWKAYVSPGGYGQWHIGKVHIASHRWIWLRDHKIITKGKNILHKCDNRACVNPEHLFLGDHSINMQDRRNKNRSNHAVGENHGRHKLTADEVLEIRSLYQTGDYTHEKLSIKFNVSKALISLIISKKRWVHI